MEELEKINEVKFEEEFANETDEIINFIEEKAPYTTIHKINALYNIKEYYKELYQDVSHGKLYYTLQKSAYATTFDFTMSNGKKFARITIDGNYNTLPKEVYQAIINKYKVQAEIMLPFLDDKICLSEKEKRKSDRKTFWFIIISGFLFYCFLLILLYVWRIIT